MYVDSYRQDAARGIGARREGNGVGSRVQGDLDGCEFDAPGNEAPAEGNHDNLSLRRGDDEAGSCGRDGGLAREAEG